MDFEDLLQAFLDQNIMWIIVNDKLHREFVFDDFISAFSFMSEAAMIAEKMNHHPEWSNVYNKVIVDLITYDNNSITKKDLLLAKKMETIAKLKLIAK